LIVVDRDQIRRAYERLVELEERGATLDDILNGPEGYIWIQESCGGDFEVAKEAFSRAHPGARFVQPDS
jgi:hypothetical protein